MPAVGSGWALGPEQLNPQVLCVLGGQWGDEGKGKLVDFLGLHAAFCCRFNGGHNAGHQLVVSGIKKSFHILPCGILHPNASALLGNGVVVHLKQLVKEIRDAAPHQQQQQQQQQQQEEEDAPLPDSVLSHVFISSRAHLLFDFHAAVDRRQENLKAELGSTIGTTLRGIGPCYSTKVSRTGIRAGELLDWEGFEASYRRLAAEMNAIYGDLNVDTEDELRRHRVYRQLLGSRIVDTPTLLHAALSRGQRLLLEGANGALLDVDMGTYPFVTSSNTTAANACMGLGLPPKKLDMVVGVVKAYCTRVGQGPMPTELTETVGDRLRSQGGEFGVTTGRPRRCGWLDIPLLRHSNLVNGFDCLCLTKLDVLTGIDPICLCIAYKHKETGDTQDPLYFPSTHKEYLNIHPVYEQLRGWTEDISACKTLKDLPKNAQVYVHRIEQLLGVPIWWIGVGADRNAMVLNY